METELGSVCLELKDFLEGAHAIGKTCYCGGGPEPDDTAKELLISAIQVSILSIVLVYKVARPKTVVMGRCSSVFDFVISAPKFDI